MGRGLIRASIRSPYFFLRIYAHDSLYLLLIRQHTSTDEALDIKLHLHGWMTFCQCDFSGSTTDMNF